MSLPQGDLLGPDDRPTKEPQLMAYRFDAFAEFLHEPSQGIDVVTYIPTARGGEPRLFSYPQIDLSETAHRATSS